MGMKRIGVWAAAVSVGALCSGRISSAARPELTIENPPAVTAPSRPGCHKDAFKIAIDIGHYKAAPGATSARGVTEFTYNGLLAQRLLQALRQSGFTTAFLIGESGEVMPLDRRPEIAREANASIFISLHHDSVQKQYLSTWLQDGRAHAFSDRFHGYSIFISARTAWSRDSFALATDLGTALEVRGLTPSLHHAEPIPGEGRVLLDSKLGIYRFDELRVLQGATMPALLLESAIIVNRDEEAAIQGGNYHPRVVAAILEAVTKYCDGHPVVRPWPPGAPVTP